VCLGFSRTFFLRAWYPDWAQAHGAPEPIFYVHGVAFAAWFLLLLAQPLLPVGALCPPGTPPPRPFTHGSPTPSECESPLPGLYFCGYYVSPTGMLREIAREAGRISAVIARRP
jgi:hypothetical protein